MKTLIVLISVLTFLSNSRAQEIDSLTLDSLTTFLTLQTNDGRMVSAYNTLTSEYLAVSNHETATEYANLAKDMAREISDDEGELEALCNLAHIYSSYNLEYQKSIDYLDQAYELSNELELEDYQIRVNRGYTATFSALGDYDNALVHNESAIKIAKSKGDNSNVSDLSAYGGNIYEAQGDTVNALKLYKQVVDIETANNFENCSNASLIIVAHYYNLKGDLEKSIKQYKIALTKFERLGDQRWVAYTHSEMCKVYLSYGKIRLAEIHGLEGLRISEELKLEKEITDNYSVLIDVYAARGDSDSEKMYQIKYDSIMDLTQIEVHSDHDNVVISTNDASSSHKSPWSGVIQALIILGLVVVSVLIYGMISSKK